MKTLTEFHPSKTEIDFLESKLFQHNRRKLDNYTYQNFIIKSVDDSDSIVAGIHCQMAGDWIYITSLWIDKKLRLQGMGTKLLSQVEKIAVQNKCVGIYLYTYSFQSPLFYQKHGFHVFGSLEKFCGDHSRLYMKKILVNKADSAKAQRANRSSAFGNINPKKETKK